MLIDHDAFKKELTRKAPHVSKAVHAADIDLEEARGWLVTNKGMRMATVQNQKPLSRMIKHEPRALPSWSRRA